MLSGRVELLFLLFLIASWTCELVSCMYVVLSLLVVCLMVFVNYLLNAFAICLCVMAVLLLKEIVVLCVWVGFLFLFLGVPSICLFCIVV